MRSCHLSFMALLLFCWLAPPPSSSSGDELAALRKRNVQRLIDAGNFQQSIAAIRNLPASERISWIDELRSRSGGSSKDEQGGGGGMSLANYGQLIQLIEHTVEADWENQGGTSNIVPFHNGVRIKTDGTVERIREKDIPLAKNQRASRRNIDWRLLGDWQKPTDLRWVSLGALDTKLKQAKDGSRPASIGMELLGGICRLDYLLWDSINQSWLVGGPAGNLVMNDQGDLVHKDLKLPPVLLEDVIAIASHVLAGDGEMGCTIDPDEARLRNAYTFVQSPGSQRALRNDTKNWLDGLQKTLGVQYNKVIGLRQDSPTAYALFKADVEMKRLGLGLDPQPPPIRSYWTESDIFQRSSPNGLIRWWYTLSNTKIHHDSKRNLYHFQGNNVQVLSEAQFINAQGTRVAATNPDIAADAFAKNFSQNHEALQKHSVVQGRLRHIFDLAVIFEIIRQESLGERVATFHCLNDKSLQPRLEVAPIAIDSSATTHVSPNGNLSAVVSGGVSIRLDGVLKRIASDRFSSPSSLPELPEIPHLSENENDAEQKRTEGGNLNPLPSNDLGALSKHGNAPFWFD